MDDFDASRGILKAEKANFDGSSKKKNALYESSNTFTIERRFKQVSLTFGKLIHILLIIPESSTNFESE